jgi:nucleotide-binding universal stress UspA family protein
MRCFVFRRVLVGLDDTPLSERLVACAAAFARAFDARVTLLSAYDWSERTALLEAPTVDVLTDAQPKEELDARSHLDQLAGSLRDQGIAVELIVLDDTATDAILQESRREPETLVVLGAHAHSWLARLLHGDTSRELLGRFEAPVLIVPERR